MVTGWIPAEPIAINENRSKLVGRTILSFFATDDRVGSLNRGKGIASAGLQPVRINMQIPSVRYELVQERAIGLLALSAAATENPPSQRSEASRPHPTCGTPP
jgi:hypothetical protein